MKSSVVFGLAAIGLLSTVTSLAYSPFLAYALAVATAAYGLREGFARARTEPRTLRITRPTVALIVGGGITSGTLLTLPRATDWSTDVGAALAGLFVLAVGVMTYGIAFGVGYDLSQAARGALSRRNR